MEIQNVKNQIRGRWKLFDKSLNRTIHYSFDEIFQYITETSDKTHYNIFEKNGGIFYSSQETVEIVAISTKVMVWKKNNSYHVFEKIS
jgi:hypothetical protein